MPTEPAVPTVAEVMHRAVEVCDPTGEEEGTDQLLARFEDRDEPITSLADPEADLADIARLDDGLAGPAEVMSVALATYLAHRRDQLDGEPNDLLRMAARAEWEHEPPPPVRDWLEEQGIAL